MYILKKFLIRFLKHVSCVTNEYLLLKFILAGPTVFIYLIKRLLCFVDFAGFTYRQFGSSQ